MRKTLLLGLLLVVSAIAGCGGGGGGSTLTTSGGGSSGGSSGGGQTIVTTGANVVTMTVDSGPACTGCSGAVDIPYITLTVCVPGTTQCQTFDHIEVDSGSYGLRILADATDTSGQPFSLSLPHETVGGNPVAECTQFVDGYSWGPVDAADVDVSSESASSVPMQVIGDPNYQSVPSTCSSTGTQEDTVATFGANGIIGVGVFAQDCGSTCAQVVDNYNYYACPSTTACTPTTLAVASQVTDPVVYFQTDNNGVIVELPPLGSTGTAASVSGSLVFGIGTQGNNTLTTQNVLTANNYGDITTTYKGQALPYSFLDTGSNAYYFDDSSIPDTCVAQGNWFCPSSTLQLSATNLGQNGVQSTVDFTIANAASEFNTYPSNAAYDDIGASAGNQSSYCPNSATNCSFDFGLPFFFGHNVFVAFYGATTSGGTGPYFAY
ncbi:MAG: DUF3443 domain-containing protein [Steroidobacteraceae bacterium]